MDTYTETQSPTDRARHRFVDRCVELANFMGDGNVMALARDAAQRRGKPLVLWDDLQSQINVWQRVALQGRPQDAAARWAAIVAAVESVEPACETCADGEISVCVMCGEDGDNGCSHFYGPCPDCSVSEEVGRG